MKNCSSIKAGLLIGIIFLLILSIVAQMVIGYNDRKLNETPITEDYNYYHISEIPNYIRHHISKETNIFDKNGSEKVSKPEETIQPLAGPPMDSPWPMYCHDTRHTGQSPYITVDTWDEIWNINTPGPVSGGSVIDEDGTIYIGAYDLCAVYLNGSEKWRCDVSGWIMSCPAIDENGTIYIGTKGGSGNYMYAIYPDGTVKWKHPTSQIYSSPAIANDGTIIYGNSDNWDIEALYPNGTLRWRYKTNLVVYSSPAIGEDGTVYCGSHDNYLYALYLNNGTLKWKYKTGDWIRTSPCIGDDGTIYVVSLDNYLHAVNPNGTLKWKTNVGAGTSPTIGQDGTIYAGYKTLHAINPVNGSVKWTFNVGGTIRGGTPCNSADGTIYVGTSDGGEIIAINPDGTLKWRKEIGEVESPPSIGANGNVYIGTSHFDYGRLRAFGWCELEADANGPYYGQINESIQFQGSAEGGYRPYSYHWDFGDGNASDDEDPIHIYTDAGNYTVTFTLTDNTSNSSSDTTFAWIRFQEFNYPPDKPDINGPTSVKVGQSYDYSFNATDPDENNIWYHICWGDKEIIYIYGPYSSGEELKLSYTWLDKGNYPITCWARDVYDEVSDTATLEVEVPRNRMITNLWYLWFLERFPILQKLLLLIN